MVEKASRVTFEVSKGEGHPVRIAHINNLKDYVERPLSVNAVTLVAEDVGINNDKLTWDIELGVEVCQSLNVECKP